MNGFDSFNVGDNVYCLAWIGKQFEIVARDSARGIISLQGSLENLPHGAQVDIFRSTAWMITRERWDQIWYWPDRAGESYQQVYDRFVGQHKPGSIITGHQVEGPNPLEAFSVTPENAMSFMLLRIADLGILIQPVIGIKGNLSYRMHEAASDPAVRWIPVGPPTTAAMKMTDYRWSLTYGDVVLNWRDFVSSPGVVE